MSCWEETKQSIEDFFSGVNVSKDIIPDNNDTEPLTQNPQNNISTCKDGLPCERSIEKAYFATKKTIQVPIGNGASLAKTSYIVKSGDYLSTIAEVYEGVSYQDIAKANGISASSTIFPGQELTIPNQIKTKDKIVYEKISSATLGEKVFLVVETKGFKEDERVNVKIYEEEPMLVGSGKELPFLKGTTQHTEVTAIVKIDQDTNKQQAMVEIALRPKMDKTENDKAKSGSLEEWKNKFKKGENDKCYLWLKVSDLQEKAEEKEFLKGVGLAVNDDSSLGDEDCIVLYIPSSYHKELDSTVLLLSPDIWEEFNKECQVFEKHARALASKSQTTADKAKEDIARKLGNLHKKTKANILTEVRVLGAKKATYIRASTIKKHIRKGKEVPASKRRGYLKSYKVDKEEIKQAIKDKAFITKRVIENKDGTKTTKRVHFKNVNTKKFKKALQNSVKQLFKDWYNGDESSSGNSGKMGNLGEFIGKSADEWIKDMNAGLSASSDNTGKAPKDIYWDWSGQAQVLRYYFSGAPDASFDSKEKKMFLNTSIGGNAKISLAEAYATCNFYFPNKEGFHGEVQLKSCKLNFGYLRAKLELKASGFVGASLMGSARIGLKYDKEKDSLRIKPVDVPLKSDKKESGAKASINAFAGVEIGGTATGALSWHSPEQKEFKDLFTVGGGVLAACGIGADADFYITYSDGKIVFRAKGKFVYGLGLGGELLGSVGLENNWEFIVFVYHQLNNNNFSYLEFIDENAYMAYVGCALMMIEGAGDVASSVTELIKDTTLYKRALGYYNDREAKEIAAEDLAERIISNPDIVKFAPPEAQGATLYKLTETFYLSLEERQEEAILVIFKNIQTKKEFTKVVERITPNGTKGDYKDNFKRLVNILDGSDERNFYRYMSQLIVLLDRNNYPDKPNIMKPIQQRIVCV